MKHKENQGILYLLFGAVLGLSLSVSVNVFAVDNYTQGVEQPNTTDADIWFDPTGFNPEFVTVHYTINGADQHS